MSSHNQPPNPYEKRQKLPKGLKFDKDKAVAVRYNDGSTEPPPRPKYKSTEHYNYTNRYYDPPPDPNQVLYARGNCGDVAIRLQLHHIPHFTLDSNHAFIRQIFPTHANLFLLHEIAHLVEMARRPGRWDKITFDNNLGFGNNLRFIFALAPEKRVKMVELEIRTLAIQRHLVEKAGTDYDLHTFQNRSVELFCENYNLRTPEHVAHFLSLFRETYHEYDYPTIMQLFYTFMSLHMPRLIEQAEEADRTQLES